MKLVTRLSLPASGVERLYAVGIPTTIYKDRPAVIVTLGNLRNILADVSRGEGFENPFEGQTPADQRNDVVREPSSLPMDTVFVVLLYNIGAVVMPVITPTTPYLRIYLAGQDERSGRRANSQLTPLQESVGLKNVQDDVRMGYIKAATRTVVAGYLAQRIPTDRSLMLTDTDFSKVISENRRVINSIITELRRLWLPLKSHYMDVDAAAKATAKTGKAPTHIQNAASAFFKRVDELRAAHAIQPATMESIVAEVTNNH